MNQRERTLGLVVAALLVLVVGYFVFSTYSGWVQGLRNQISGLETTISDKDAKITRGQFAAKRLKEFAARSLPGNPEVARSLYKAWLLELAEGQVKLASPIVTSSATPMPPPGASANTARCSRSSSSRVSAALSPQLTIAPARMKSFNKSLRKSGAAQATIERNAASFPRG